MIDFFELKAVLGYDVKPFLKKVSIFLQGGYLEISAYYSEGKNIDGQNFETFFQLNNELETIFVKFVSSSRKMTKTYFFEVRDILEEIDRKFKFLSKVYKWSRSSESSFGYRGSTKVTYTLPQLQTLEDVSKNVEGDANFQDDWISIAFDNRLREEDYSVQGGQAVDLFFKNSISRVLNVTSVVSPISNQTLKGIDFDNDFYFQNDGLGTIEGDVLLENTVYTLLSIRKGTSNSYPSLGIQQEVIVGVNRNLLNLPVLIRQIRELFNTDDTLKDFKLVFVNKQEDTTFINFEVSDRLGNIKNLNFSL